MQCSLFIFFLHLLPPSYQYHTHTTFTLSLPPSHLFSHRYPNFSHPSHTLSQPILCLTLPQSPPHPHTHQLTYIPIPHFFLLLFLLPDPHPSLLIFFFIHPPSFFYHQLCECALPQHLPLAVGYHIHEQKRTVVH